jgi:GT2 family glycosyltransferase
VGVALLSTGEAASTLQRLVWPDAARADRTALYARWKLGPIRLAEAGSLPLAPGAVLDLATFFNAFSHRKWRATTGLATLALRLRGQGRVRVVLQAATAGFATLPVAERELELGPAPAEIAIDDVAALPGEILFAEIVAGEGGARLGAAEWVTRDAPKRSVRLAAVVTTFRREAAARAAIARFAAETIPALPRGDLHLFVVDNGQSLGTEAPAGVTILPNRNLGGAGGFTRGLLEAREAGRFTHALFMDDDAACEPESVWRAIALLARLNDPRASVAGAMLLAGEPTRQYEKGALLARGGGRSIWRAIGSDADLALAPAVSSNDGEDAANYGGWWFFAFPLAAAPALPFPFFVRGDDVDFALANDLPVVTLNGIATWCESFAGKLSPATEYLAWRSWVALAFLHGSAKGQRSALLQAGRAALRIGGRFDYAAMQAALDGLEHALGGPAGFAATPAPLAALGRLRARSEAGAPSPAELSAARPLWQAGRLRRLLGLALLAGHLLPLSTGRTVPHARVPWEMGVGHVLTARAVLLGEGASVEARRRDRAAFFAGVARLVGLLIRGLVGRRRIAAAYAAGAPPLRDEAWWRAALDTPPATPDKP